jgi:hypothetical protein
MARRCTALRRPTLAHLPLTHPASTPTNPPLPRPSTPFLPVPAAGPSRTQAILLTGTPLLTGTGTGTGMGWGIRGMGMLVAMVIGMRTRGFIMVGTGLRSHIILLLLLLLLIPALLLLIIIIIIGLGSLIIGRGMAGNGSVAGRGSGRGAGGR